MTLLSQTLLHDEVYALLGSKKGRQGGPTHSHTWSIGK